MFSWFSENRPIRRQDITLFSPLASGSRQAGDFLYFSHLFSEISRNYTFSQNYPITHRAVREAGQEAISHPVHPWSYTPPGTPSRYTPWATPRPAPVLHQRVYTQEVSTEQRDTLLGSVLWTQPGWDLLGTPVSAFLL